MANPALTCQMGDTITFNFATAATAIHPFSIYSNVASQTIFPGYMGPVNPGYTSIGTRIFMCDSNLASSGPATYICDYHPSMTSTISIYVPGQPTNAPTNKTRTITIPTSTTVPVDLSKLKYKLDLGRGMYFYWKMLNPGDKNLTFAIQAPTSGWVGIGFGRTEEYQMLGSDAFIGFISPTPAPPITILQGYILSTKALDTTGILANPDFIYNSASASLVKGITTLLITRPLDQGLNPITFNNVTQPYAMIIAAYSNDNTGVKAKHVQRVEYGKYINLYTGQSVTSYRIPIPTRIAHGVCMGTAYAILFPCGLLVARYGRDAKGLWFKIHFFLQNYAFLVMLAGVIIGFTLPVIQYGSFTYHAILGTIIFGLTVIQVLIGYLRPHKKPDIEITIPRRIFEFVHHWLGRAILLAAIAQIVAGIMELEVSPIAYGIWLPFLVILFF